MPVTAPLILIPVYNNAATLRRVVEGARARCPNVLVVNDGSTDGGPATLDGLDIHRLDLAKNQGKGQAIRAGAEWALERGYSHVITIDADGQHDPDDLPGFLERVEARPEALLVGTRDFSSEEVPRSSRFGRQWSNLWIRIASGAGVGDSQSGYRAYPTDVLTRLDCTADRYNFEIEILVRAAWADVPIKSIPVSVRYFPSGERVSHFRPFMDNWRITRTFTRLVIRNFIPWPHRALDDDPHPVAPLKRLHRQITGKQPKELKQLSLRHPIRSLRLLHIEQTAPGEVGAACALGILLGALPLIACHTIVILFCATRMRLNRAIAFYASSLCAPPFVPALDIEVGYYLRHGRFLTFDDLDSKTELFRALGAEAHLRLWEYLLGSLVVGPVLAIVVGGGAFFAARAWRKRFREKKAGAIQ